MDAKSKGDAMPVWMLQTMEEARDEAEAREMLAAALLQDGARGGRALPPSDVCPRWRVQVFSDDEPEAAGWLPDGVRRVLVLESQRRALGL